MAPNDLHETTGYVLARTCKFLRTRVHGTLEEIGLYRGQQFILHVLWENEGVTHSELAERTCVQPATITNALQRMEKAGLVERRQDEQDQRVSRVYLTDAGRSMREKAEQVWRGMEVQAFAGFSEEEQAILRELLTRVQENLMRTGKE
jgi:DNA-binding MarR family transcriptional regulator